MNPQPQDLTLPPRRTEYIEGEDDGDFYVIVFCPECHGGAQSSWMDVLESGAQYECGKCGYRWRVQEYSPFGEKPA